MSRVIVKGLPKNIKEQRLKSVFESHGCITDCSLKYTKEGVFRKFAFIGYQNEENAKAAVDYFNNSFIDTSKIAVQIANSFGDENKPRAWSKYSRDSSAYQKMIIKLQEKKDKEALILKKSRVKEKKKKTLKHEKIDELLGELKDDPQFMEFLELNKNRSTKLAWTNEDGSSFLQGSVKKDENVENKEETKEEIKQATNDTVILKDGKTDPVKDLSDLQFLKSKTTKSSILSESESDSEDVSEDESEDDSQSGSEGEEETVDESSEIKNDTKEMSKEKSLSDSSSDNVLFVVKMKGLPMHCKKNQIKEFFKPLVPKDIKTPSNAKGKRTIGIATVEFEKTKDIEDAMKKNKNFIGAKKVYLYKIKKENKTLSNAEKSRPWEQKDFTQEDGEEESVAESGRLYIRNLAYVCKEEDIEHVFSSYGNLTEVHLPIDSITKQIKGFAFVTFMFPEHAVKAFTELDGTVFQGRMLHILPAKAKKEEELDENAPYKKKKEAKQKATAGSSHNWNTLFLGANAVVDVLADKYDTTKRQILDHESKQSLGVRLALGETQIIAETRDFLMENGVELDCFSQAAASRSKTVILVKNLPAGTQSEELFTLFSKYGTVPRIILPPSGITAIIEYNEPTEARAGFTNLAYTKFQYMPLYLEWAPVNVFKPKEKAVEVENKENNEQDKKENSEDKQTSKENDEKDEGKAVEPEESKSTVPMENGHILFVKNLNFDTTEQSLREHFEKCGKLSNVTVSRKKDMKRPGQLLSMGYGFVEYLKEKSAQKALRKLQNTSLDGHSLEIKVSNRITTQSQVKSNRVKQDPNKKQASTKILVRNIPFEAKVEELKDLFKVFGEIKSVRLPKKLVGTGSHRGFAFLDFHTKADASRAFNALCHSTHLYGRRLVLEWADEEETVDQLRKKTASHFHDDEPSKKFKKSTLIEDIDAAGGNG